MHRRGRVLRKHALPDDERVDIRPLRAHAPDEVAQLPLAVRRRMRPRAAQPGRKLRKLAQLIGDVLAGMQ